LLVCELASLAALKIHEEIHSHSIRLLIHALFEPPVEKSLLVLILCPILRLEDGNRPGLWWDVEHRRPCPLPTLTLVLTLLQGQNEIVQHATKGFKRCSRYKSGRCTQTYIMHV
jgi:hypothetical protein